jgi:hypothetical protein
MQHGFTLWLAGERYTLAERGRIDHTRALAPSQAEALLRSALRERRNTRLLLRLASELSPWGSCEHRAIEEIARRARSGELVLVRTPRAPVAPAAQQRRRDSLLSWNNTARENEWIEVQLIDEQGEPIAGVPFRIVLSDRTVRTGTTSATGVARFDGIPAGVCKLSFTHLDQDAWEAA